MTITRVRQLADPCGRTSIRLDAAVWSRDARHAIGDLVFLRAHRHMVDRSALAPNGTPLYGKRTLRNPSGYLR